MLSTSIWDRLFWCRPSRVAPHSWWPPKTDSWSGANLVVNTTARVPTIRRSLYLGPSNEPASRTPCSTNHLPEVGNNGIAFISTLISHFRFHFRFRAKTSSENFNETSYFAWVCFFSHHTRVKFSLSCSVCLIRVRVSRRRYGGPLRVRPVDGRTGGMEAKLGDRLQRAL